MYFNPVPLKQSLTIDEEMGVTASIGKFKLLLLFEGGGTTTGGIFTNDSFLLQKVKLKIIAIMNKNLVNIRIILF